MSHFTVLVVGENPEDQLQPFHEFECTGEDDQYVQDLDVTAEARSAFDAEPREITFAQYVKEWHGYDATCAPNTHGEHKYGYALLGPDGEVVKVIKRTNPNAKWDWYVLGGRWTGFFKLRNGASGMVGKPGLMTSAAKPGFADAARVGEVDFDGIELAEVEKELPSFDRAHAIITKYGIPPTRASVRESATSIEEARRIYRGHPAIGALDAEWLLPFSDELHDRFCGFDRAAFIAMTRARAWAPYAMLINGAWIGRGEMGWFGVSHGDVSEKEWHAKVRETVLALPPDTLLSVYDCHI